MVIYDALPEFVWVMEYEGYSCGCWYGQGVAEYMGNGAIEAAQGAHMADGVERIRNT